jgi:hypothetical protein
MSKRKIVSVDAYNNDLIDGKDRSYFKELIDDITFCERVYKIFEIYSLSQNNILERPFSSPNEIKAWRYYYHKVHYVIH